MAHPTDEYVKIKAFENERYDIVRFRFKGQSTLIKANVSLTEAQEHCKREDTHGEGWFDGYRRR